jgi:hypothetical protein
MRYLVAMLVTGAVAVAIYALDWRNERRIESILRESGVSDRRDAAIKMSPIEEWVFALSQLLYYWRFVVIALVLASSLGVAAVWKRPTGKPVKPCDGAAGVTLPGGGAT